jgi:GT2 family glycosyltransferase
MLADIALEWGALWLLWLDADQTFPPDTLTRLLARRKAIVGANCRRRDPDKIVPTAYIEQDGGLEPVLPSGDDVQEVANLGLAVCLTHANVFRKIGQPYFFDQMLPDGIHAIGEDVSFCRKARAAGFPVFVDHALSRAVGHMSSVELKFPDELSAPEVG